MVTRHPIQAAPDPVAAVEALVAASETDPLYADLYLRRAEVLLAPILTRARYEQLRADRKAVADVARELRQAVDSADWGRVHALAVAAETLGGRLPTDRRLMALGEAVHGPRVLRMRPAAFALGGVAEGGGSGLARERDAVLGHLRLLIALDAAWAYLYRARLAHFEALRVGPGEAPGPGLDGPALRHEVLDAVERGDFERVERLAAAVARQGSANGHAWLAAAGPPDDLAATLPEPGPGAVRPADLGLALAELPRESDPDRFRDSLGPHPIITSGGHRYVPPAGPEALLVEIFAESEPDCRTALLESLGLPRRRGLPRLAIEDALRRHGADVCESLGLDPARFGVTCVPFDAYARLAPRYGWGREPRWTHFDGYQVTREFGLRALAGGDVRYGGPDDLVALGRNYDSERLVARFAVVQRRRLTALGS
jgi:hypothetical protein